MSNDTKKPDGAELCIAHARNLLDSAIDALDEGSVDEALDEVNRALGHIQAARIKKSLAEREARR